MPTTTLQGFQLAPQQKRLWLLQENDGVYLTQGAIGIEGDLQSVRLKQVVEQIVARHQILRTNFSRLPGVKLPMMTIGDRNWFGWEEIDLRDCTWKLEKLFEQAIQQEYNLETEPVLRLFLYQVSASSYILQIILPTLCSDRWTLKNLFNEIVDGYANYSESQSENEVVQYVQFSEWQNELLTDEDAETAQQFWQQQETERRGDGENFYLKLSIETLKITITPALKAKLETIAQKYQTTTAAVLLACWQILLWRLTEESSIVIGTNCDRREYEEMHSIMGLLATWLPIKSDFTPDLTFTEVLATLEQTLESVQEWQDYFVPESLFPIGFEFQELPTPRDTGEVAFSWLKQSSWIEKFKLKLSGIRHHDSLRLEINYDRHYFSPETITSLAQQLQTLLEDAIQHPETRIDQLAILSASDRQKLLWEFNQTQKDYSQDKCIHQLFEAQVEKTPHNLAIIFEKEQLTYTQLNQQANQLAHYLRQRGVKSEAVVGLYLEKSHLSIVGLLAILKAGGAYLPLDSNLPTAALSDRTEATQIILTQQALVSTLPPSNREIICLDQDWKKIEAESNANLPNETTKANLAYILFTSGSTGKPKGVAIEQQQLLNYYYAISDRLNFPENQNFALVSSLAADLGNTVIFPALLTGGCLHLLSPERASNPEAFADYCEHYSLDCLKIVPSHLNALLSAAKPEKILPKKCLILGGETLNWQLVKKIQQYQPNCQIINHYGPTETTVGVLTYEVKSETEKTGRRGDTETGRLKDRENVSTTVPIGKPLPNTQVYILDKQLQPVPIGVAGELYIGGAQVSRGYLNQPELTTEKFISIPPAHGSCFTWGDPKTALPPLIKGGAESGGMGNHLYKTGDKARYLPDGNIEFLGRVDHQVKIRGYRIELGEIEATLQKHPSIKDAIATVKTDKSGNKRLVAYFVTEQQQRLSDQDLHNFLKQKLPDYMILFL
jgi:amino acid adenylation domain-containing protein